MVQIAVSDELARQIAGAPLPVVLVDSRGRELGQLTRRNVTPPAESPSDADDDDWAEAKRRMEQAKREGGPFYTTKEVLEHLKSLERG